MSKKEEIEIIFEDIKEWEEKSFFEFFEEIIQGWIEKALKLSGAELVEGATYESQYHKLRQKIIYLHEEIPKIIKSCIKQSKNYIEEAKKYIKKTFKKADIQPVIDEVKENYGKNKK